MSQRYAIVYKYWGGVGVCDEREPRKVGRETLRVYGIDQETGELTEHGTPTKVTVEQVREFVDSCRGESRYVADRILDFIDNGPKKPTAEQVINDAFTKCNASRAGNPQWAGAVATALREAGYLKDEA